MLKICNFLQNTGTFLLAAVKQTKQLSSNVSR